MKLLVPSLLWLICTAFTPWEKSFEKAKQRAVSEQKFIILNFSGSDWCGPCIRLHKEILENPVFTDFADRYLILVNADFPRQKKNQLSKSEQFQNEQLADAYNSDGKFPFTVMISPMGKVVKKWDGYPKMTAYDFVEEIKKTIIANQ